MIIDRLQVELTGGTMGRGVATHYSATGGEHRADYLTWWQAVGAIMSGYVSITVPSTGDSFDSATGELVDVWSLGESVTFTGGGSGGYAGGVGAIVSWQTASIIDSHKVRGRTFVVPLAANSYDSDGTLTAAVVSVLAGASANLITNLEGDGVIWHRPVDGSGGQACAITDYRVPDRVSSLKSRR